MIDEPEVSMQPPSCLQSLLTCREAFSDRTQVIVATHSDRRFLEPHEVVVMDLCEDRGYDDLG